jgi:NADH:ubiquinone oxidoreductase subunit 6 (subunit J)
VVGVLLALLAAVALASTGSVAPGTGSARRPSHQLLDTLASLLLIWIVIGSVLVVGLVSMRRDVLVESAQRRRERGRLRGLLTGTVIFLLLGMSFWIVGSREQAQRDRPLVPQRPPGAQSGAAGEGRYEPRFALVPVLLVGALVLAGITAGYLAHRAGRRRLPDEELALALADVLAETLDDLRTEGDPRRAVIGSYARMERALAAFGLPRRPAEAPEEYVERILLELEVGTMAVRRLTALYARAKFSHHHVDTVMKDEAIGTLESVRSELRAAEIREAEERAAAVEAARERAVGA